MLGNPNVNESKFQRPNKADYLKDLSDVALSVSTTDIYINILLDTILANPVKAKSFNYQQLLPKSAEQMVDEDIYLSLLQQRVVG